MGDLEDEMLAELLMGDDNDEKSANSNEGETKFDPYEDLNNELYDPVPEDACQYGKPFFWDKRYMSNEEAFDWYHPYSNLRGIIKKYVEPDFKVLIAGCGNSRLCEDMVDDGFSQIVNVDISRVVVDQMEEKYTDTLGDGVEFRQMDVCDMQGEFEDKEFQAVIDKALIDTIYCMELGSKKVTQVLHEFDRLLTHTGVYICVSCGKPENRLKEFDNHIEQDAGFMSWKVQVFTIPKPIVDPYKPIDIHDLDEMYFVYVCVKSFNMSRAKDQKRKVDNAKKLGLYVKSKAKRRKARRKKGL